MIKIFIKDALTYIFKDKQILRKSPFLLLLLLLYSYSKLFAFDLLVKTGKINLPLINFIVLSILTLIVVFSINGYRVSCIKNLISQSELPFLDLKANAKIGIKYTFAAALLYVPFYYILVGCGFFAGCSGIAEHVIFGTIGMIFLTLSTCLVLVSVFYNFVCLLGVNRVFAETENWFSFVKFKEILSLIKANKSLYFVSVGLLVLLTILNILVLFVFDVLFVNLDIAYLTILPVALASLYEFYVSVFLASKFTEYQADQHQLQA